ncbi:MAG: hypothetical protein ACE5K2_06870 [Candidatus Zixiibacteriota bacterium]
MRTEAETSRTTLTPYGAKSLGVILIEFSDAETNDDTRGGWTWINHEHHQFGTKNYTTTDYTTLFFSSAPEYVTPNPLDLRSLPRSPDGDAVFGSVNDYFQEVSYGQVSIRGNILNKVEENERYVWLRADYDKDHYVHSDDRAELIRETIQKARAEHQADPEHFKNPDDYEIICVLYAGNQRAGGLWPGGPSGEYDLTYIISEKRSNKFNHIGIHCHELAHTLGLDVDKYGGDINVGRYGLMGTRVYNGSAPVGNGACPAHPSAKSKIDFGLANTNSGYQ